MFTAPNHDWDFYAEKTQASDAAWIRTLESADRFALYESLFNAVWAARTDQRRDVRLEKWHWDQKLRERRQFVDAFAQLDRKRRGQSTPNDAR